MAENSNKVISEAQLRDKLDSVRDSVRAVQRTNEFGLESTVQTEDPTLRDPYKSEHKSSVRCSVFFGPIWIAEIVGIEHREENSKTPVYHYASEYFSDILEGKYIVKGNLYVYETKTNELQATIAKYKEILKKENYSRALIKDIVSQRNNLFKAGITERLLAKYGPEEAARMVTNALRRINSEIITGRDWDIPKLIIVSGDISDENPVIDVFEDVTFESTSKAILADGATQIRVISWFGKKRPIRDTPPAKINIQKFRIDFDATVRSFIDSFFSKAKSLFRVSIREMDMPIEMNPNNLGYIGNLPAAIAGWGPELCLTPFRVDQYGLPETMTVDYDIVAYREDPGDESGAEIIRENRQFTYTDYTYTKFQGRSVLIRPWRFFFSDPDYLIQATHFISRALPTHRGLSYSWIIPPPAIPGASPDPSKPELKKDLLGNVIAGINDYVYKEEEAHPVTGSTLTAAFFSVAMHEDYEEKGVSYVRAPVRNFVYYPPMSLIRDESEKGEKLALADFSPIVANDLYKMMNVVSIPGDLSPSEDSRSPTLNYLRNDYDVIFGDPAEDPVNPNLILQTVPTGIIADEWFILAPASGLATVTSFLDFFGFGVISVEDLTLGLIGNCDKVNQYEIDLQAGFGNYPFGVGVDNISVQVFGVGLSLFDLRGKTIIGSIALQFGSHARITRGMACSILNSCECLKTDTYNYIYSLNGFDGPGFKKTLLFSAAWSKQKFEELARKLKLPVMLVRVISATPKNPFAGKESSSAYNLEYVSAVTTKPSSKVTYTSLIRCDRAYLAFDQRWPGDIFNSMARISTNAGMDSLKPQIAKCIQLFSGTVRVMKHHSILTGLTENFVAGGLGVVGLGGAGLVLSTTALGVKTLGLIGSATLDSAEGIWNIAINMPVISFAVDMLGSVGIDLTTIFQDTYISRGDGSDPSGNITNLLRISAYSQGYRYILIKDKLVEIITKELYNGIKELVENNDQFDGAEILRDFDAVSGGKIKSKVDSQVVGAINRFFQVDTWSAERVMGENLDRLIQAIDMAQVSGGDFTNIGSQTTDVYTITKRGPKPSGFVLDEAVRNVEAFKQADPEPKGIVF